MESKLPPWRSSHSDAWLLIEPVWNRNAENLSDGTALYEKLLIEPVWNRNHVLKVHDPQRFDSFNRTSMESKRLKLRDTNSKCFIF